MRKVIISLAPISASDDKIDPREVANDVIAASKCGAAMAHLHVRDKKGRLTKDLSTFKKIVELIRAESNIIIQASTGGVSNLTIEERCAPLDYPMVETASMNIGSMNLGDEVFLNPLPEAKYCVKRIYQSNVLPEYEVFEIGMINSILMLKNEIKLREPLLINTVLGMQNTIPATIDSMVCFRQFVPKEALWGITHSGREDFSLLAAAISMGATIVRIGFEDSRFYEGDVKAENNTVLVKRLVNIIESVGLQAATAEEARKIFQLTSRL